MGSWVIGFFGISIGQYTEDGHNVFLMRKREDEQVEVIVGVHSSCRGIYNSIEEL